MMMDWDRKKKRYPSPPPLLWKIDILGDSIYVIVLVCTTHHVSQSKDNYTQNKT